LQLVMTAHCLAFTQCGCMETVWALYSAFGKSLCTYERGLKWCPRASIQAWTCLILFANSFCRSAFGKSLCTYKVCWKWCPRASIQAWTCLISFTNSFCRSACEMFLMNAITAVFNWLSVRGRSRYTDNQIYLPQPKCTATFRTHCTN
jgi:hypothetical protein